MSWSSGERKSMTKKFRMQLINSCDPLRFPMMTLAQLTCEQLDLLLYIVTGISPATRPHDFGANCKRDARKMCRQQHLQQIKRQPGRMDQLTDDLDNLPVVAMRLGYQPEWLSPALRQAYFQSRSAMQAPGFGSGNGGNPEAPPALVNTVAVPGTPLREVPPVPDAGRSSTEAQHPSRAAPVESPLKLTNSPHVEVPSNAVATPIAESDAELSKIIHVAGAPPTRTSCHRVGPRSVQRHPATDGAWSMPSMKFDSLGSSLGSLANQDGGDHAAGLAVELDPQEAGVSGRNGTSPPR